MPPGGWGAGRFVIRRSDTRPRGMLSTMGGEQQPARNRFEDFGCRH